MDEFEKTVKKMLEYYQKIINAFGTGNLYFDENSETVIIEDIDNEIENDKVYSIFDIYEIFNINYVINSNFLKDKCRDNFMGCELMVACGGPNVWIDTNDMKVKLYWGGYEDSIPFNIAAACRIDDNVYDSVCWE